MFAFLKGWRPRTLVASWIVYWILLGAISLGPAVAAIIKATRAGEDKGDVSISLGNVISLIVHLDGQPIYSGSATFIGLALAIAGPPLLLYVLWLMQRPQRAPEREREHSL